VIVARGKRGRILTFPSVIGEPAGANAIDLQEVEKKKTTDSRYRVTDTHEIPSYQRDGPVPAGNSEGHEIGLYGMGLSVYHRRRGGDGGYWPPLGKNRAGLTLEEKKREGIVLPRWGSALEGKEEVKGWILIGGLLKRE